MLENHHSEAMLLLLFLPVILGQSYISVPPVKLLTANLFGTLYPASHSEYRNNSTGYDIGVSLSDREEANNMPKQELILPPGGKAVYQIPINEESLYLMVKPGKREDVRSSPFSNKANISLSATWPGEVEGVSVNCSRPKHDIDSLASHYCTLDLGPLVNQSRQDSLMVTITVPSKETRDAAIWQLHLSPLDDSGRVMATFEEDGRKLMRKTQDEEATNTWLTMVSIVGNTGVGKSTVASLLSGNETMFKVKGSTTGTTTIGADISTIIPADHYRQRMEDVLLQGPLFKPEKSRPLFLIDSEGMSFRGDEVDFVTTGPVAVIANIIVWITTGRLRPPDILQSIQEYMNGLDRITMGDETSDTQDYGEFIVVLNMMQESEDETSDEEMCEELMTYGDDDDAIRDEMETRFKKISCIGLPEVDSLPINYTMLEKYPRFREGLFKMSNKVLQESETPINVRVGNNKYEMNSTEAETIIGTLIDAANEGNIDLSDICNVLFSMTKEKVIQKLAKNSKEMEGATNGMCDNSTQSCTVCVCKYRNSVVEKTKNTMNGLIDFAMDQAEQLCADPKVKNSIAEIVDDILMPWISIERCSGSLKRTYQFGDVCDIVEIQSVIDEAEGEELSIHCDSLHICGNTYVHNSDLILNTSDIYVNAGATIENPQSKSANGHNGGVGQDGSDGSHGEMGKSIKLVISGSFLTTSEQNLKVILRGGNGGDGGRGGDGKQEVPGRNGIPGAQGQDGKDGYPGNDGNKYPDVPTNAYGDPTNCDEVVGASTDLPSVVVTRGPWDQYGCTNHCGKSFGQCHTCKYWCLWTLNHLAKSSCQNIDGGAGGDGQNGMDGTAGEDGTNATPGTKGGNGGMGGNGGEAGQWHMIAFQLPLEVDLCKIGGVGGAGGQPGKGRSGAPGGKGGKGGEGGKKGIGGHGGNQGYCSQQWREWTSHQNKHEAHKCDHGCHEWTEWDHCTEFLEGEFGDVTISQWGNSGSDGSDGTDGHKGADGKDGSDVGPTDAGKAGNPGMDSPGYCILN